MFTKLNNVKENSHDPTGREPSFRIMWFFRKYIIFNKINIITESPWYSRRGDDRWSKNNKWWRKTTEWWSIGVTETHHILQQILAVDELN